MVIEEKHSLSIPTLTLTQTNLDWKANMSISWPWSRPANISEKRDALEIQGSGGLLTCLPFGHSWMVEAASMNRVKS
jgi:hypothetical protein